MQDGNYEYQFEIAAREASRAISFSSASNASGNAPGLPYVPSTSHSVGISMSNGADSWSKGSIPLSIVTNGGCLPSAANQLAQAQARSSITQKSASSSDEGADGEAKFHSSSSSCSGLKERDYIGLSDSSSSSVHYSSTALDEKHDAKTFDLKDTELRLGLGPSIVSRDPVAPEHGNAAQSDASKTVSEARSEYNVVKIGASHASEFDHPEPQVAPSSNPRKNSVDGITTSEKASRPAQHQSFQSWNGERGHPATNAADKSFIAPQGNESRSVTELAHVTKEKPWNQPGIVNNPQQNDFCRQDATNPHVNAHSFAQKPPNGSLDPRFASRETQEKASYDASSAFQFWPTQKISRPIEAGFLAPPGQDANKSELENGNASFNVAQGGLMSGRYAVPVPKVSTVPAKRPYFEAMGDNRTGYPSEIRSDPRANGASVHSGAPTMDGTSQAAKVHTAPGVLAWNNVMQLPAGWQMGVEQSKGVFGAAITTSSSALPPRNQVAPQFKPPAAANAPAKESAKEGLAKPSTIPAKNANNESQNDDGGSRAPVVGWPPIRSFRKNTLAAHPKPSAEDQDMKPSSTSEPGQPASSTALYVKAKLDGVKICRKVDLKAYDSYDSLKLALQDMFHGFVNAPSGALTSSEKSDNGRFDLFRGSDYVLTHEDKDGDWMLVGDVPWEMFVTTVKSLRIMKESDALGLGQRASEKLKAQATTT